MNRNILRQLCGVCVLVCSICFSNISLSASALDTAAIKTLYLKHFSDSQYMEAEHELRRLYFFGDSSAKAEALFLLGGINKRQNNWDSARVYYTSLINDFPRAKQYCAAIYQAQLMSYLLNDVASEVAYYKKLQRCQCADSIYFHSEMISVFQDLELYNWDAAKQACKDIFEDSTAFWDSVFQSNIPQLRSVKKARNLSLIPGAGQCYSGEKGRAALSFLLQSSLTAGVVVLAINQYYFLGGLVALPLLIRIHEGGKLFAVKITETKNQNLNMEAAAKLQQFIINYSEKNSYLK